MKSLFSLESSPTSKTSGVAQCQSAMMMIRFFFTSFWSLSNRSIYQLLGRIKLLWRRLCVFSEQRVFENLSGQWPLKYKRFQDRATFFWWCENVIVRHRLVECPDLDNHLRRKYFSTWSRTRSTIDTKTSACTVQILLHHNQGRCCYGWDKKTGQGSTWVKLASHMGAVWNRPCHIS